jgi:DNA mismatch repair protein MutL
MGRVYPIALLSDHVINQIAAGEVIENPASVVKELVENAIDAGATSIDIEILAGGAQLIKVVDDGCGMRPTDAELALLRHATSKLRELSDLDQLHTMGFRGEALAAIASVSILEMTTSPGEGGVYRNNLKNREFDQEAAQIFLPGESDLVQAQGTSEGIKFVAMPTQSKTDSSGCFGITLLARGGEVERVEAAVRNRGTTFEVRSLFFNAPARRKFQKSTAANTSAVMKMVRSLACAHSEISFSLTSNQERIYLFSASDLEQRVRAVLGEEEGLWFEQEQICGFLGTAHKTRQKQFFYLNRRPIVSHLLSRALREGFGTRLPQEMHPTAVLFIELSPTEFDVNVHPQKREVRFRDEQKVFFLVRNSIQQALLPRSCPSQKQREFTPCTTTSSIEVPPFQTMTEEVFLFDYDSSVALAVVGSFLLLKKEEGLVLVELKREEPELSRSPSQALLVPITLSCDKDSLESLITRLETCGVEARALQSNQLCIDALPHWLNSTNVARFIEIIEKDRSEGVPITETLKQFINLHPKQISLTEAEEMWRKGSIVREIRIEAKDLEYLFLKKK